MAGWLPEDASTPPPFERAERLPVRDRRSRRRGLGRNGARATYERRRRGSEPRSRAAEDVERPSWMPTGPGTYGRFLAIRVFDFWVHERDITTPLDPR